LKRAIFIFTITILPLFIARESFSARMWGDIGTLVSMENKRANPSLCLINDNNLAGHFGR